MFCPNCGSKQNENRRFCTKCGTNLQFVSHALTGGFQNVPVMPPPMHVQAEIERQNKMAKGVRFAIIGGGIVALKFFSFIFAGPFRGGSPFGFWSLVGFVLLAIGISKIISSRSHEAQVIAPSSFTSSTASQQLNEAGSQPIMPKPYFSELVADTGDLHGKRQPMTSVTEDNTQTLPPNR